jgi:uncharacterized protein YjiS (DUF1127 family)
MRMLHGSILISRVVSGNERVHLQSTQKGRPKSPWRDRKDRKMTLIDTLKAAAANRAMYRRTRDEIARMPRDVALDLGIFPEDADRIAWAAVYGK